MVARTAKISERKEFTQLHHIYYHCLCEAVNNLQNQKNPLKCVNLIQCILDSSETEFVFFLYITFKIINDKNIVKSDRQKEEIYKYLLKRMVNVVIPSSSCGLVVVGG